MGELHRQVHQKPVQTPELVTVTMTLSKAAWARLKMKAEFERDLHDVSGETHKAMEAAIVLDHPRGKMLASMAAALGAYDVEKVTRELDAFFSEPDTPEEAQP